MASIKRIRAGLPSPRLAIHDPWALRALIAVMMVAAYVAAGDERAMRVAAAFDWNGVLAPANVRVDAWVTPPLYTGKPPIILSAANKEAALPAAGPLPVPAGSTLIVRSDDPIHDPAWTVEQLSMEDLVLAYMSQGAGRRRRDDHRHLEVRK